MIKRGLSPIISAVLTTGYGYDTDTGELNSMTYPSGLLIGYQRDANGAVSGLTANGQPLLQEGTRLAFGPLKGYTFGDNQQAITKNYDQRYNLTAVQGGGLNYQYSHDLAGRVKSISGVMLPVVNRGQTTFYCFFLVSYFVIKRGLSPIISYVLGNPVNFVDPRGLMTGSPPWCGLSNAIFGNCPEAPPEEWYNKLLDDVCSKSCESLRSSCKKAMAVYCYTQGTPCLTPCDILAGKCLEKQREVCRCETEK